MSGLSLFYDFFLQIDVAGSMYLLDIPVDTVSGIILILCFGLAVDYSAHIGHSFMIKTGSKNGKKQIVSYIDINLYG